MIQIILSAIFLATLGLGLPVDPAVKNQEDEVILIPYQVTFVPVEVSVVPKDSSSKNQQSLVILKDRKHGQTATDDDKTGESTEDVDREPTFDLFKEKFSEDLPASGEDLVLVPISTLKRLEDDGSEPTAHSITKRQAPGRNFRGSGLNSRYRPRYALVGYLNNYDDFPTLS
ncbi:hypothetical protein GWI33_022062 [Rhynchophorus ferrugineus]|uniref:Uncharacterized protein n=1 Tax=Rhynchophorus ferrugineus TaxID=354439 RepID=A0A834IV44_RHYFE|nr:hypothetical protein GWI33_009779 [Rhynchophorus ferrugineus]KAF7284468.1 hypothetical protein GWI33_022062 [Rhynchophorus ferrugineus]